MLRKGLDAGFKDVNVKDRFVSGYISHFGSLDSDGDIIEQGAYSKSIKERGPHGTKLIKYLLDHDKKKAIGVFKELKEDSTGLYYEARIGTHNAGVDFVKMVESEIINQHSIGYSIVKEQKRADGNHLTEIKLLEGSALQFLGANSNTPIVGLKSIDEFMDELETLERALKNGTLTDETYLLIETKVKSLYNSLKPDTSTLAETELINHIQKSFKLN